MKIAALISIKEMINMAFIFEKLDVYQKSVSFATKSYQLCRHIHDRNIKDQLQRAALSIPLNIAEGNGKFTSKEKSQFFRIARGSLFECIPLLQICHNLKYIPCDNFINLYNCAQEIGMMLNGLINSYK